MELACVSRLLQNKGGVAGHADHGDHDDHVHGVPMASELKASATPGSSEGAANDSADFPVMRQRAPGTAFA